MDNLMSASFEDLASIKDIGNIIAKSVCEFFKDENNIDLINRLKEDGVNMSYLIEVSKDETIITGKTFVLT